MESLRKKHTLTFYRRMANTNPNIMKIYKSAVINRMSFKQLVKIYTENNLKFEEDINRLLLFRNFNINTKQKLIHEMELKTYNSILLSNLITKKYPYLKQDSITYAILNMHQFKY
jgi:hypothetical protein